MRLLDPIEHAYLSCRRAVKLLPSHDDLWWTRRCYQEFRILDNTSVEPCWPLDSIPRPSFYFLNPLGPESVPKVRPLRDRPGPPASRGDVRPAATRYGEVIWEEVAWEKVGGKMFCVVENGWFVGMLGVRLVHDRRSLTVTYITQHWIVD